MIVRIHMEDQYRLSDAALADVENLDKALLAAVDSHDAAAFETSLQRLLAYVREHGEKVPTEEIISSDLILPSEDMTLDDAHEILEKEKAQPTSAAAPTAEAQS